nr:aldose epimerase [Propionibacterium sp.]
MSRNGEIVHIAAGAFSATLASAGATLVSFTHAGCDLVLPFDPAGEIGTGYRGRTLAPWPGRITDGRYAVDGVTHELPVNERATGAALHGLVSFLPWTVESATPAGARFTLDLPASPGYPFDLALAVDYTLDAAGLGVRVTATNQGDAAAPVGLSSHPYLTCGVGLDACTLDLPASSVLPVDDRKRPGPLTDAAAAGLVFADAPLAGRSVDHAFTGLPALWRVTLAGAGRTVWLASDAPWVQVFTADGELGRAGLAVEPLTCPPDAFNTDPVSVRLAPGGSRVLTYAIGTDDAR